MDNQCPSDDLQRLLHEFDPFPRSREQNRTSAAGVVLDGVIHVAEANIKSCDDQIAEAYARIEHLKASRSGIARYVDACKTLALPSPIHSIPNEILEDVFDYALDWCDGKDIHLDEGLFNDRYIHTS